MIFSNVFFKKYNRLLLFLNKEFFELHIMMENRRLEEGNVMEDIRNLFRLKA